MKFNRKSKQSSETNRMPDRQTDGQADEHTKHTNKSELKKPQGKRYRHVSGTWWWEINGLLTPIIFEMLFW